MYEVRPYTWPVLLARRRVIVALYVLTYYFHVSTGILALRERVSRQGRGNKCSLEKAMPVQQLTKHRELVQRRSDARKAQSGSTGTVREINFTKDNTYHVDNGRRLVDIQR